MRGSQQRGGGRASARLVLMPDGASSEEPDFERRVRRRLPEIYVLCALFVTVLLSVLTPPFFVPDEANHSLRAMGIAHGHVLAEPSSLGAGGEADRNAYAAMQRIGTILATTAQQYPLARSRPDGRIPRTDLEAVQRLEWAHAGGFSPFPNTAVYPPTLYLPQVAGWALGEHENLTIVHSLELARLCAALASILLGWLALRHTACSRMQMFVVLLLPTCLSLNASASQDALLFGAAALGAACLSRPLVQRRAFRTGELALTAVLLTVCIGARVPYMPLLLLLFLPSLNMRVLQIRSLAAPAAAAVCAGMLLAVWQMLTRGLGMLTGPGADAARQVAFLHAHPAYAGLVVAKSAVFDSSFTLVKGLALLGTNDAAPPLPAYAVFALAIVLILLMSGGGCLATGRARLLLAAAVAGSAAAMSLAEYLIWSVPGSAVVQGLQARYYLPLLLLLALALPARPLLRAGSRGRQTLPALAFAVFVLCVLAVPLLAAHRFYDSGLIAALGETAR